MNTIEQLTGDYPKYADNQIAWLLPTTTRPNYWNVVNKSNVSEILGYVELAGDKFNLQISESHLDDYDVIEKDVDNFLKRPEMTLLQHVDLDTDTSMDHYEHEYMLRLLASRLVRSAALGSNPDECIKSAVSCNDWLDSTDFFYSPASTIYHEAEVGGLVKHTLKVYNQIVELLYSKAFSSVDPHSAVLIALCHDWCKIGLYESYTRNVKDETTNNKWEPRIAFRHHQRGIPLGHGVSSMFLASKFFRLSPEESLAIRWHMGVWNTSPNEYNELQMANENYPLVHLLQFADCLSITKYAND